jgi:hypothetical protein
MAGDTSNCWPHSLDKVQCGIEHEFLVAVLVVAKPVTVVVGAKFPQELHSVAIEKA